MRLYAVWGHAREKSLSLLRFSDMLASIPRIALHELAALALVAALDCDPEQEPDVVVDIADVVIEDDDVVAMITTADPQTQCFEACLEAVVARGESVFSLERSMEPQPRPGRSTGRLDR